jgi:thioredoxin-dependent peroxiredoxin
MTTVSPDPLPQEKRSMFAMVLSLALSAQPAAEVPKVQEGKPAPEVELPATSIDTVLPDKKDKKTLSLKDFKGKTVVLYFYPKALTGG